MRRIHFAGCAEPAEYTWGAQRTYRYRGCEVQHGIWTGEHGWYIAPLCAGDALYPTLRSALRAIDSWKLRCGENP